jgi:hypothetical protein
MVDSVGAPGDVVLSAGLSAAAVGASAPPPGITLPAPAVATVASGAIAGPAAAMGPSWEAGGPVLGGKPVTFLPAHHSEQDGK